MTGGIPSGVVLIVLLMANFYVICTYLGDYKRDVRLSQEDDVFQARFAHAYHDLSTNQQLLSPLGVQHEAAVNDIDALANRFKWFVRLILLYLMIFCGVGYYKYKASRSVHPFFRVATRLDLARYNSMCAGYGLPPVWPVSNKVTELLKRTRPVEWEG